MIYIVESSKYYSEDPENHERVSKETVNQILRGLNDEYELQVTDVTDVRQMKYLGYSVLHNTNTLYERYTIIGSFYQGIMNSFFIFFSLYTVSFLASKSQYSIGYRTLWASFSASSNLLVPSIVVLTSMGAIFIVSYNQHRKFEQRRAAAFMNDLLAHLEGGSKNNEQ